ncbi:hypothetical protein TNCV_4547051 [Trichonephila clavipes]|nr:hypothetical protein TNCV_4547051 [Trichonephila clavipes]
MKSLVYASSIDSDKSLVARIAVVAGICAASDAVNGGHGQRNGMTICLLTNSASAYNIRKVGFEFGDTVIGLLFWPACSPDLSPIENEWSMLAQRLFWNKPPAATPDQLWQYVEAPWTAVPQGYI